MIRKITLLLMMLPILGFGQTTDLFISEYGEGNSSNKYFEIYNGTGATVNLSLYKVDLYTNGGTSAQSTLNLVGTLANNSTYVIANGAAILAIKNLADTLHATAGYNGNDVLELSKNGTIIDVFGNKGANPASWTIAGNATGGTDKVLYRKASICSPTVDWAVSFGTDATDSQWEINSTPFIMANEATVISGLGTHTANCSAPCPTLVEPTATSTSICANSTSTLTATSAQTGSILTWYDVATGGSSLATGGTFTTPILNTTTSYWVQDSVSGCPAGPRQEVMVNISGTAPTVTAGSNSPICAGGTINLTANTVAGAIYGWTGPNSFTSAAQNPSIPSATALASGVYTLSITAGGCNPTIGTVSVVVNALPNVNAGVDKSVCTGLPVILTASGATSYVWNNGITNNISFTPAATMTYTVTGTDANGCVGTDMVVVTVNPLPVVTIAASGLSLTASLSGATYKWINCADDMAIAGATSQTYVATANGSYKVEVTNSNGCIATSTCMNVTIVGVESKSDLNAFSISPNPTKGKITITASGNESANVVIFNALGKEITRSNNVQNGTQLDLSAVQNGVYMVQISTDKGTKVLRIVKN